MTSKVVVITGASAGIGAALAELLARRGASLVLVARRKDILDGIVSHCGPSAIGIAADMTDRAEVRRVVQEAIQHFGHVDVWINNVGRGISRLPSELTDEDIDAMMQVNVKSALYGMQEVLPHFKARNSGHIINISSMLGRMPTFLPRAAYSASKHFLNALTANFRTEIHGTHPGIQVSLVSPGVVATDFGLNAMHGGVDSRNIPGGQTSEQVAVVIADVIESRKADVYTRPDGHEVVARYYAADEVGV
jgi:short-subunit dehydrogenase